MLISRARTAFLYPDCVVFSVVLYILQLLDADSPLSLPRRLPLVHKSPNLIIFLPSRHRIVLWMEESRTVQSSPTIRLNRLSLPTLSGLDLRDSFFHIEMDDIVSPTETTVPRGPDSGESAAFFDLAPPLSTASHVKVEDVVKRLFSCSSF